MSSTRTASAGFVPADEHIVRHLLDIIPQRHAARGNLLREEIRATVAHCLDLVAADRGEHPSRMDRILTAATRWACVGIPLDTVQHLIHAGFRLYLDDQLHGSAHLLRHNDIGRLFDVLHAVMATVSLAYLSIAPGAEQTAPHAVAAALLSGQHTAKVYREHGFPVADRYRVLAIAVGEQGEKHPARPGGDGHAVRQRMRICLTVQCGRQVPSLLSAIGGTILVPVALLTENALDDLVAALAAATDTPITAAAVATDPDRIPDAADQAHELLDMVQRLQSPPGLYRFDDLALEYQLTRPGPGRERLAALLDPLVDHPELFQTLREHIRNDFNRQRTSRAMYLHPNTVDHRLKRIGRLTGLDTALPHALYRLRAAYIARSYAHPASAAHIS
ncbi:PucR family transcriptional regulator [Nocardia pneumoniae]|uniref:PucR family transcriptional regulator n=1 Tax=Nocardia pneumoniae TaxID=228601 RepID=UPI00030E6D69|nr:helix-turn-helix domain-containing protein [Nocardia pneumoniae]